MRPDDLPSVLPVQDYSTAIAPDQHQNDSHDLLLSWRQVVESAPDKAQTASVSLQSPGTDILFNAVSDRGAIAPGQAPTVMPDFSSLPGFSPPAVTDYYHRAPWETLNQLMQRAPGKLTFEDRVSPDLATDQRLLRQFAEEIQNGTLAQDPLWKEFSDWQKQNNLSSTDLVDLMQKLRAESQSPEAKQAVEALQGAIAKRDPSEILALLKSNPEINKILDALDQASIVSGDSSKPLQSFTAAHPEVARSVDKKTSEQKLALQAEHKQLSDWADKNLPPADRKQFKDDMAAFEKRAHANGLTPEEVLNTYKQVERLTDASAKSPLSIQERQHVAESIVHLAAVPTDACQGFNGTCNVTSVEARIYTREPSAAAKLVTDVAMTGQYTASDGTTVKINTSPDREAQDWPTVDGERSHAGELFQLTAINLHYAQQSKITGKDIRYEKEDPKNANPGDTGEGLYDYSSGHRVPLKENTFFGFGGTPIRDARIGCQSIADINDQITGHHEKNVVLVADGGQMQGGATGIESEDQLRAKLTELKASHKLPVIIFVDTENEPFFTDSGSGTGGGSGGYHVVTITDYDEKTGNVCIDNEWEKNADHGRDNPVNVHDVFIAMHVHQSAEKLLKRDVDWNRTHGTPDPSKEVDLIRHELRDGTITPEEAEKETMVVIDELTLLRSKNISFGAEERRDWMEIEAVIHQLDPAAQARLVKRAHDGKVISDEWYKQELKLIGYQIMSKANHEKPTAGNRKMSEYFYQKECDAFYLDLSDLSQDDGREVMQDIQDRLRRNP